jgi:hypothetical protein
MSVKSNDGGAGEVAAMLKKGRAQRSSYPSLRGTPSRSTAGASRSIAKKVDAAQTGLSAPLDKGGDNS